MITFDEFIDLMARIEKNIERQEEDKISEQAKSQRSLNSERQGSMTYIQTDPKVIDFLRLLEDYRIKCENEGSYEEARKTAMKYDELMRKENIR